MVTKYEDGRLVVSTDGSTWKVETIGCGATSRQIWVHVDPSQLAQSSSSLRRQARAIDVSQEATHEAANKVESAVLESAHEVAKEMAQGLGSLEHPNLIQLDQL